MDSYNFSRESGRPASPPLPEDYSMGYLPQMATYSGSTQSRNTSVPQPIDFGGSASGYSSASQSRRTSVPPISYGSSSHGITYTPEYRSTVVTSWRSSNESQTVFARRIGIPQSTLSDWIQEAGSSSQSRPRAMHNRTHYTAEYKSAVLSAWRSRGEGETQADFSKRTGIPASTLQAWVNKSEGSSRDAR